MTSTWEYPTDIALSSRNLSKDQVESTPDFHTRWREERDEYDSYYAPLGPK